MITKRNLAYIKKRIFYCLDEYGIDVSVTDGNRDVLSERMPDAIMSALVRMYESLPMPECEYVSYVMDASKIETENVSLPDGCAAFSLPSDFGKLIYIILPDGRRVKGDDVVTVGGFGFVDPRFCNDGEKVVAVYRRGVPDTEGKTDDFELELSPLAVEALVCLAASELCRDEDASLYARLIYKYKDLCEGFYQLDSAAAKRNGFFVQRKSKAGVR